MSSNIYNHNSSVRDIGKLFPEEKRLGTKASDLVSGTALTKCLDVHEAFEVLGTPANDAPFKWNGLLSQRRLAITDGRNEPKLG